MKRDQVFPSRFWKAADLNGKPLVVEIAAAELENLKNGEGEEEAKTVLSFVGHKKQLPLNRTNWDAVAAICGDDTDDWPHKKIELFPDKTSLRGKRVDCIRIREPAQGELAAVTKPSPKPKPKPAPAAAAATTAADDMADEIPWK